MGEPPVSAGAVHRSDADPSAGVTETSVGAPGDPSGVTAGDGSDTSDVFPAALVAVTVNLYGWPFVSPVTVQPRVATTEQVRPPGEAVTT
jgi:hypothetical protein